MMVAPPGVRGSQGVRADRSATCAVCAVVVIVSVVLAALESSVSEVGSKEQPAPAGRPQGLTLWDQAFLNSVYASALKGISATTRSADNHSWHIRYR